MTVPRTHGLSVRARLTIVVSGLAAAAFAGVAIIAPSAVEDVLLDDLLSAEAEDALFFARLNEDDFGEADLLRDDEGNLIEFDDPFGDLKVGFEILHQTLVNDR